MFYWELSLLVRCYSFFVEDVRFDLCWECNFEYVCYALWGNVCLKGIASLDSTSFESVLSKTHFSAFPISEIESWRKRWIYVVCVSRQFYTLCLPQKLILNSFLTIIKILLLWASWGEWTINSTVHEIVWI